MIERRIEVTGMTCSACANTVEKALRKVDGVKNAEVNLITNSAKVTFEETKTSINEIEQAVIKVGYGIKKKKTFDTTSKDLKTYDETEKQMKVRLIVSIVFFVILMYVAMGHMVGIPLPPFMDGEENIITFAFAQFLIVLPIIYYNRQYFISGFKKLVHRAPNMDSLVALGASAAMIYGIFAICRIGNALATNDMATVHMYHMDLYFESAGTILTLVTIGKYLESRSKKKTSETLDKLLNLTPKTALKVVDGNEIEVLVDEIAIGDILICKPGMIVACDGTIFEGESTIDESMISGESIPVYKSINDHVVSGSINTLGTFKYRADKICSDSTVATIVKLVEEAASSKAPISRLADKISGIFVPVVMSISIIALIVWLIVGASVEFSLSIAISVLVISCPCALGLATPLAIMVGTGVGANNHILFKSAVALENLHNVSCVVFDKTGTITEGKPKVQRIEIFNDLNIEEILSIILGLEEKSSHPLASAVIEYANIKNIASKDIEKFETIVGKGVKGFYNNHEYYCGSISLAKEKNVNCDLKVINEMTEAGMTLLLLFDNKSLLGAIGVSDSIKATSKQAIGWLNSKNIKTIMLTGDNKKSAQVIADQIGIDEVISEVLPAEKERVIATLQQNGNKVAMVGDGINDSIALTKADIGIAIGAGSDIAIDAADIILMRSDLIDVVDAIRLSKKTLNNIKMNLFWAFFYNIIGIPLAAGVLYQISGIKLNPMIAALAMSLSSICVCLNALRIRLFKPLGNKEVKKSMVTKTFKVEGMMCEHCVKHVKEALLTIDGVVSVDVDLKSKVVKMESKDETKNELISQKISEAGYKVTF